MDWRTASVICSVPTSRVPSPPVRSGVLRPSASLGESGPGLYEPVHGSAPDIAGTGKANPLATLLSVAMMLRYGLGMHGEAESLERAVDAALAEGLRTPDLEAGEGTREVGTDEMTEAVIAGL